VEPDRKLPLPAPRLGPADTVWLPQPVLLGTEDDTHDVATAIAKVLEHFD
jgi:hypothetical protein